MGRCKAQKNTTQNSHSSIPFFNKSGMGSFFSGTGEPKKPFFLPKQPIPQNKTKDVLEKERDILLWRCNDNINHAEVLANDFNEWVKNLHSEGYTMKQIILNIEQSHVFIGGKNIRELWAFQLVGAPELRYIVEENKLYNSAIKNHEDNINYVKSIITDTKFIDTPVKRNTIEMIEKGRMKLFIATQTHDSERRAMEIGKGRNDQTRAYFGTVNDSDVYPSDKASYNINMKKNKDVIREVNNKGAFSSGNKMVIIDPKRFNYDGKEEIVRALVHETQHYTDKHRDEKGRNSGGANDAWISYKTEFRSFWQADKELHIKNGKSDREGTASPERQFLGFSSSLQEAIFDNLMNSYGFVKENWEKNEIITKSENPDEENKSFRSLAAKYSKPKGINLENSIRIDDFYLALRQCNTSMDATDHEIKKLFLMADRLKAPEAHDILKSTDPEKKRLRNLYNKNLSKDVLETLIIRLSF